MYNRMKKFAKKVLVCIAEEKDIFNQINQSILIMAKLNEFKFTILTKFIFF